MNHRKYSAYPEEQEVLLYDGCRVIVLGLERYKKGIKNASPGFLDYQNRPFSVIHLFMPDLNLKEYEKYHVSALCDNHDK